MSVLFVYLNAWLLFVFAVLWHRFLCFRFLCAFLVKLLSSLLDVLFSSVAAANVYFSALAFFLVSSGVLILCVSIFAVCVLAFTS